MSSPSKQVRTRNFSTIVYVESAPENWQSILADQFVPAFISPYHDKDINPTGELKKPHYHVVIMFDSVKTHEQAKEIFSLIGGVGCEIVKSLRGMARYLCHLDNPDKYQYCIEDVVSLCGADYTGVCSLTNDKYKAIREMMLFIDERNIISYADLLSYSVDERFDWFRVLCDCGTYVIKEYINARYWKMCNYQEVIK